jgi:tetratricopeptide (TPR) repeat protein
MTGAARTANPLALALAAITLSVLGWLTWQRGHQYLSAEILWRDTLRRNPDAFIASNNLGAILLLRGDLPAAKGYFEAAMRSKPDYAEGLDNLGLVSQREGRLDEAVSYYRDALRRDPGCVDAHNNLGIVLAQRGNASEALGHFQEAVRLKPSFAKAHQNLGLVLEGQGRAGDAANEYREALRWSGDAPDVERRLAWILATDPDPGIRNGAEAVRLAQAASAATGDKTPQSLDVLAAAYAEAGRFDDAVRTAERVLALANDSAPAEARQAAEARLALYRSRQALRTRSE